MGYKNPPRTGHWLLNILIKDTDHHAVVGDFEEVYLDHYDSYGRFYAYFWYWLQVVKSVPVFLRNIFRRSSIMFRNYIKIALRNIVRHKTYSFINIFGLSIGISCCMLILLFIQDELSYDTFHEKSDRIYRVVDTFVGTNGVKRHFASSSAPFATTMKKDFAEVEDAVRLIPSRIFIQREEIRFNEDTYYADASLFNIFSFPLVKGNPETALQEPNTIVISESAALKYFGAEDPLNQTLTLYRSTPFTVTGVMKDIPKNAHFRTDFFLPMKNLERIQRLQGSHFQNWVRHEFYTYVLLRDGASPDEVNDKLPAMIEQHAAKQVKDINGGSLASRLQPLQDIHLYSDLQAEMESNSDIKYIYIFSIVAIFILLIACINFMNLSTARSANRAKEVGLRKVSGASRKQIVKQFLGESLVFTFAAAFITVFLVWGAIPLFNSLTGKTLAISQLLTWSIVGSFVAVFLFVSFISGSYPALFISRFQPIKVLKGAVSTGSKSSNLRRGLVVSQFSLSVILIIGTGVVIDQLDFLRNRKLGFNKDHVVVLPLSGAVRNNYEAVKAELLSNTNIVNASVAIGVPGGNYAGDSIMLITDEGPQTMSFRMIYSDHDYIKTMGMEIIEGRDFTKEIVTDAMEGFIINEALVRQLQLENPLETRFEWGGPNYGMEKKGKVIGVVKDFQFQSLKDEISPTIIHINPGNAFIFAIKIRPENVSDTIAFIRSKWTELNPGRPFEYSFMDETFDQLYNAEERLSNIFLYFSILAIFIAALGLFGLASFMVEQRTKELGIRKVLGASVQNLIFLVAREFGILVAAANLLAWPIAYYFMDQWLQTFAYRVDLGAGIFLVSTVLALVIALITVSYQSIKASLTNPVNSLRYE